MTSFNILDETSAASRILVLLLDYENGIGVVDMHDEMKKRFNVGRGATDTSKRELQRIKLITFQKKDIGAPRKIHAYQLTPKGRKVAEKLQEIKNILDT